MNQTNKSYSSPRSKPVKNDKILRPIVGAVLLLAFADAYAKEASTCNVPPPPDSLLPLAKCCQKSLKSEPSCATYSAKDEYVVVQDSSSSKPHGFLIIPTEQMTGIEDTKNNDPKSPVRDIWYHGWNESKDWPNADENLTGLAINSKDGRDQYQLHIHIACADKQVLDTLNTLNKASKIGTDVNHPTDVTLKGHPYEALKLTGLTGDNSPFNVYRKLPHVKGFEEHQSVAIFKVPNSNDYYLVNTYSDGNYKAHAEELLDQSKSCGNPKPKPKPKGEKR